VTTVTLQAVISGIQFFAYRVSKLESRKEQLLSSSWSNGIGDRFYSFETAWFAIVPGCRLIRRRGGLHPIKQDPLLRVEGLKKVFRSGEADLVLFENLSFQVNKGEMLAIVGQSGTGKSTLLHIVGALDRPSAGAVYCAHSQVNSLSEDDAAEFRNREIGFVWQFHYLLPEFTALENVAMPLLTRGQALSIAVQEASSWLRQVGLEARGHHRSGELSGGEQQRLALARALITKPQLLLADEPTGDLDGRTAEVVFELIARLHREHQLTSLIATHNLAFARRCHRVMRLDQGRMEEVAPESLPA
jgi:lipoprotein-releasing system ATP-binding protein